MKKLSRAAINAASFSVKWSKLRSPWKQAQ
jgi:hypothetical protein